MKRRKGFLTSTNSSIVNIEDVVKENNNFKKHEIKYIENKVNSIKYRISREDINNSYNKIIVEAIEND